MRIFYIAHFDCAGAGGHAAHVRGCLDELARQGHEVWLFASGRKRRAESGVRFIPIPQIRRPGLYTVSFGLLCWLPFLWTVIRRRPRVAYSRFFYPMPPLALLARLLRVPLVVEVNADLAHERRVHRHSPRRQSFENGLEGWIYRRAEGIVVVAPAIADSIRARFGDLSGKIVTIPNGVDTILFHPQDAAECRRRLGLATEGHYVTFAGAFQRWQGLRTLVQAAEYVLRFVPNTVFLLAGDGPERESIETSIAQLGLQRHFVLAGWRTPQESSDYIGASDVCVAPYGSLAASSASQDKETMPLMSRSPMKNLSYLACGRPVITSSFREAGGFVQSIDAGLSVPPEDAAALGSAIVTLLQDPARARRMGRNGRRAVEERFSWAEIIRQIVVYLDRIAPRRGTSGQRDAAVS
ncbi:MAG: glycosyltransferase family 4 protein [Candidatus Aminicenantes bacterium]|nr:glycosyltransferase family 4 protein [Candidatus Aminicenantes bacterium]